MYFFVFLSCMQCLNANSVGDGVEQATLWKDEEVKQEGSVLLYSYFHLWPGDPLLHTSHTEAGVPQWLLHCRGALCGSCQEML